MIFPSFKAGIVDYGLLGGFWPVMVCVPLPLQGNLYEFLKLTGWRGSKVLYFGDHIYSDLAVRNLSPQRGWGAVS